MGNYSLNSIRSDIRDRLSEVNMFLVNADILNGSFEKDRELVLKELIERVLDAGVEIFMYMVGSKNGVSPISIEGVSLLRFDSLEKMLSKREGTIRILSLGVCSSDIEIMKRSSFSFVPVSAPLEVKMSSSYVTHNNGIEALEELLRLLVEVKCSLL